MSKAIARFFHILDTFSNVEAIKKIEEHSETDFNTKEATRLITVLGKAKSGTKVKTSDTDFLSEYGADLNQIFPPPDMTLKNSSVDIESSQSTIRLKKELFETQSKLELQTELVNDLKKKNNLNLGSGQEQITLTMKDGDTAVFTKVSIPPEDIESKTQVPVENGRHQEWLNEFNLSDILKDFKDNIPQLHPGLGYGSVEEGIYVLDGSRRRQGRILYNESVEVNNRKPYDIYIPADPSYILSAEDALFISATAKKQKELSSVERGLKYALLTTGEKAIPQQDLAKEEGVSPSLISELKRVVDIPKPWLDTFPDIYKITDNHIKRLYKIAKNTPNNRYDEMTNQLADMVGVLLKIETNPVKITTELVKLMESIYKKSIFKEERTDSEPVSLWNNGKGEISLVSSQDSKGISTLKLAQIPDEMREPMMAEIIEVIKRHANKY